MALAPAGLGLDIVGYSNTLNDRFTPGTFPSAPTQNPSFWQAAYDFSGVGWASNNAQQSVVMISPLHFIGANHYRPTGDLSFMNQDGVVKTYAISNGGYTMLTGLNSQRSDLVLGRLAAPIPDADNILNYAILDLPAFGSYVDLPLEVYGWYSRVGTNTIDGFYYADFYDSSGYIDNDGDGTNDNIVMAFDQDAATGEARGVGGDSGSPSFVPWYGSLSVVGIHSAADSTSTYDAFVPVYIDDLQSLLAADGYSLLLVPEPSGLMALIAACGAWLAWLRRRRG